MRVIFNISVDKVLSIERVAVRAQGMEGKSTERGQISQRIHH
jgi:hypothetical protein